MENQGAFLIHQHFIETSNGGHRSLGTMYLCSLWHPASVLWLHKSNH